MSTDERKNNAEYNTDYLSEQIKNRPLNRRKLLRRTLITAFLAVLFGTVACFVFLALTPIFNSLLNPQEEPAPVVLPAEIVEEEIRPEDMVAQDEELYAPPEAESALDEAAVEKAVESAVEKVLAEQSPDADHYATMYDVLKQIAENAMESMAVVSVINEDYDWFNDPYETTGRYSGVILAKTGQELLILVSGADLEAEGRLRVTFRDGTAADAAVRARDTQTGCAVLTVSKEDLEEDVFASLTPFLIGHSAGTVLVGKPVIAIGAPMGELGGVNYGIVTAGQYEIDLADTSYRRITTDIYGSRSAGGVLVDLNGKMVGVIDMSHNDRTMPNLVSAIGISELRDMVQDLSNGIVRPRLGIHGADVPETAMAEMAVPRGVYVRFAEMESPAMEAGIQSGDVITSFNGAEIGRYGDLIRELSKCRAGDEVKAVIMRAGPGGYTEAELTITLQ